jgi:cytochrome c5
MNARDDSTRFPRLAGCFEAALALACSPPAQPAADTSAAAAEPGAISSSDRLLLASAKLALPPGATSPADLPDPQSGGAQALSTYCTSCHALPDPAMHSATDWPGVVRRMWLRMDLLQPPYQVPKPELGERIVMLDYLTNNALQVSMAQLPARPGRATFQTQCTQCHALPDPAQHSTQDWYVVVRRMNQHMRDILGKEMATPQIDSITRYLGEV